MAGLSANQRIMVFLDLIGGPKYRVEMQGAATATERLARANTIAAASASTLTKKTFLQNQTTFTARRGLFYTTLALAGATAAVVKLGFSYTNTMQQASVALKPMFSTTAALNAQMNQLFRIAALTPFQFKDIVLGFTQMLKAGTESAPKINQTISAISDILSSTPGRATASNLNRVTTAISHMLNLGHVTGQMRLQLARLGIPLDLILKNTLGATDDQLQNIAKSGITATQVLDSLIKASKTMPRFIGQAQASQLNTLSGVWSTFKDFLSQASAGGTGGAFGFLFSTLQGVDKELANITKTGKAATLTDVAKAFDKRLTPSTHSILNTFVLLTAALKTFIAVLGGVFLAVTALLTPFDYITKLFGANNTAAKLLGSTLGALLAIYALEKTALMVRAFWKEINVVRDYAQYAATRAVAAAEALVTMWYWREIYAQKVQLFWMRLRLLTIRVLLGAVRLISIAYEFFTGLIWKNTAAIEANNAAQASQIGNVGKLAMLMRALPALTAIALVITVILMRKQIDKAVTGFLNKHHLGYFTGENRELADSPYDKLPGFAKKGIVAELLSRKKAGLLSASEIAAYRRMGYPGLAGGGILQTTGMALVGERGPEIAKFPGGTRIFNKEQFAGVTSDMPNIVVRVYPQEIKLDGEKIAEVVSKHRLDRQARR